MNRRWNPTNAVALGRWLHTRRTAQTPAEYACAVEHNVKPRTRAADVVIAVMAVATLAAFALGLM